MITALQALRDGARQDVEAVARRVQRSRSASASARRRSAASKVTAIILPCLLGSSKGELVIVPERAARRRVLRQSTPARRPSVKTGTSRHRRDAERAKMALGEFACADRWLRHGRRCRFHGATRRSSKEATQHSARFHRSRAPFCELKENREARRCALGCPSPPGARRSCGRRRGAAFVVSTRTRNAAPKSLLSNCKDRAKRQRWWRSSRWVRNSASSKMPRYFYLCGAGGGERLVWRAWHRRGAASRADLAIADG